jgi:hypothetical protein
MGRPHAKKPKLNRTFRLSQDVVEALKEVARRRGQTVVKALEIAVLEAREALGPEYERASHLCVCEGCFKEYIKHPMSYDWLDSEGHPWLTKLCDGRLVKL